jgi:hypothetical protein
LRDDVDATPASINILEVPGTPDVPRRVRVAPVAVPPYITGQVRLVVIDAVLLQFTDEQLREPIVAAFVPQLNVVATLRAPPMFTFFATPNPPATTNAPVVVEADSVDEVMFTVPVVVSAEFALRVRLFPVVVDP